MILGGQSVEGEAELQDKQENICVLLCKVCVNYTQRGTESTLRYREIFVLLLTPRLGKHEPVSAL